MEEEKVYPISEKKLADLKAKGLVPLSKPAGRFFTFGILILSSGLFKSNIRRILYMLTNIGEENSLDYVSVILAEATWILLLCTLLIFSSNFLYALFETKFLYLPFGKYKEGARKLKNPISIKTEVLLGFVVGPIILLLGVFSLKAGDFSNTEKIIESLPQTVKIIGFLSICLSLLLTVANRLKFRLAQKMSKAEIIKESLEGQMSPANRSLIDRASGEM